MKLQLSTMRFGDDGCIGVCAVGPQDKMHPNKMPFKGTLLLLDVPSDKPPHGAEGHRIYVPTSTAKKRLSSLINMGVNYSAELGAHAPQHKVGVITGARIEGNKVLVHGFFWQRDFPKVKQDMQSGRLGMSMELQDVTVRQKDAPVWYLEDFHFSGATILFKSAAAYTQTSLSAGAIQHLGQMWGSRVKDEIRKIARKTVIAAAAASRQPEGGHMKPLKKEKAASNDGQRLVQAIAAGVGPAISRAVTESLEPFVGLLRKQQASITRISASVEEAKALSLAAAHHEDEDAEEEVEEVAAKAEDDLDADSDTEDDDGEDSKKKKHDEEDDDNDNDEDLDAALEDLEDDTAEEDKPGELNKDFENMGDKTTRTGRIGKPKHMKELVKASSTRSIQGSSVIRELYASHRALRKKYRNLKASADNRLEALTSQVEALSDRKS